MKKAKACYADGGVVGSDGLTDAQREKKNATLRALGMSSNAPAPVQAPVPVPAPQAPQPAATGQGIMGILKGRQQQIDKAAGYACGGKVKAHANGGKIKGIGTTTSDSIPAKVRETGEQIKVSTGERIVSSKQEKLLQRLAKAMGYKSLDEYLEAGTGKPVGPTIKGGMKGAYSGMPPTEETPYGPYTGDGGSPLDDFKKWQQSKIAETNANLASKATGTSSGSTDSASVTQGQFKNTSGEFGPSSPNALQSALTPDQLGINKFTTGPAQTLASIGAGEKPPATGYMPDSSGGGFVQGNRAYNVNATSQPGIQRVTSQGTSPLYTNIKPEDAVSGLNNQSIGQPAREAAQGLERIANANKIRGEMIANMAQQNGQAGSGLGISQSDTTLPGGISTTDWNNRVSAGFNTQMTPVQKAAYLAAEQNNGIQRIGQDMLNEQAAARNLVTMRGQDINALGDRAKLAMLERNDQRQADQFGLQKRISEGALADSEAQRTARNNLNAAIASGDPAAISKAHTMAVASGLKFDREDKGMKPIEIADPTDKTGMRKILVQPNADGTYTPMQAKSVGGESSAAPKVGDVKGGFRFKGGDPSNKANWEKV